MDAVVMDRDSVKHFKLVGETSDIASPARGAAAGDRNMRRIVLLFGLALTLWLQNGTASADWHTVKAKWNC